MKHLKTHLQTTGGLEHIDNKKNPSFMQIVLNLANHLDTARTKKSLNIDNVNTDKFESQNC